MRGILTAENGADFIGEDKLAGIFEGFDHEPIDQVGCFSCRQGHGFLQFRDRLNKIDVKRGCVVFYFENAHPKNQSQWQ